MVDPAQKNGNSTAAFSFTAYQKIKFLLGLVDRGYWIFTLHDLTLPGGVPHCGCHLGNVCPGPGKHPLGRWSEPLDPFSPQTRRYIDASVRMWPQRGWGLHVGKSNLAVLDIDPRHGGDDTAYALVRDLDLPLRWPSVVTGGCGVHYYFRAPAAADPIKGYKGPNGRSSTNISLGDGVEFFSGQHYVVLPFSPHASGGWYVAWDTDPAGPVPPPLLDFVSQMEVFRGQRQTLENGQQKGQQVADGWSKGPASSAAAPANRASAWLATRDPAIAGQGGRRHTAATARALVVDFALPLPEAWALLVRWNESCVPPWDADQLHEILAWADGHQGPRGAKLAQRPILTRFRADEEVLAAMQGELTILVGDFAHSVLPDGRCRITALPRQAVLSEAELESIGAGPALAKLGQDGFDDIDEPEPTATAGTVSEYYVDESVRDRFDAMYLGQDPDIAEPDAFSRPQCTCAYNILLHQSQTCRCRILTFSGKRADCPVCWPRRKEHYRATIRHHLQEHALAEAGMQGHTLYTAVVPELLWQRVGSSIRAACGSFFRLDHGAMGSIRGSSYLVVSTVKTSHVTWLQQSPQQVCDTLCATVDAWPSDLQVRVWWSSRDWKLLPDRPEKKSEWDRVQRLRWSRVTMSHVLEEWGLVSRPMVGFGRFWAWSGIEATYPSGQWESLREDLDQGEPVNRYMISVGADPFVYYGSDGASLISRHSE
jgi:Bifunctional DNA primase/polymerase, N-terminal